MNCKLQKPGVLCKIPTKILEFIISMNLPLLMHFDTCVQVTLQLTPSLTPLLSAGWFQVGPGSLAHAFGGSLAHAGDLSLYFNLWTMPEITCAHLRGITCAHRWRVQANAPGGALGIRVLGFGFDSLGLGTWGGLGFGFDSLGLDLGGIRVWAWQPGIGDLGGDLGIRPQVGQVSEQGRMDFEVSMANHGEIKLWSSESLRLLSF